LIKGEEKGDFKMVDGELWMLIVDYGVLSLLGRNFPLIKNEI